MREVDQALARAFAQRAATESAGVPPAPHLPIRPSASPNTSAGRGALPDERPAAESPSTALVWPATIRTLEREFGERFERLADALVAARDRQGLRVVLFTSCHRAEGRTTLVLTLARALARRPGRTLVVDTDLSGPMLARQLGLRPTVGLDDVVEDGHALADAIVDSPDDHLAVLPLRAAVSRPRDFLSSAAWERTVSRLRREFDLILLDGSPLFAGLSSSGLHHGLDAAVLVRNRALTGDAAVERARRALDASGVPLLGLAETFV